MEKRERLITAIFTAVFLGFFPATIPLPLPAVLFLVARFVFPCMTIPALGKVFPRAA